MFLYILFCICITVIFYAQGHIVMHYYMIFKKYDVSVARPVSTLLFMHTINFYALFVLCKWLYDDETNK